LVINNRSPVGAQGDLTSLTLLSAIITGPDEDVFSVGSFVPGTVLPTSDTLSIDLLFAPEGRAGAFQAMLSLTTDQNNAFGVPGEQFNYQLAASAVGLLSGDFNLNGQLDVEDINLLTAEVIAGTNDVFFDVNSDSLVDSTDRRVWVEQLKKTWFGDANLDDEFNSTDMVAVFATGKYETGEPVGWAEGDWNGDALFTTGDMVVAFVGGGYEKGPRPDNMVAVPEPGTAIMPLVTLAAFALGGRRRKSL
jgi:hypothetical protein